MQNPKQPPPPTRLARRKARKQLTDAEREARRLARRKAREQRYAAVRADRVGGFYVFEELGPAWGFWWSRDHVRRMVKQLRFPAPHETSPGRIGWSHEDLVRHRDQLAGRVSYQPTAGEAT